MATKKKRSTGSQKRSAGNPSNYSSLYKGDASGVAVSAPKAAPQTAVTVVDDTADWQSEYAYVFRDIRTLLIVSLALFALILVVGFLI